MKLIFTKVTQLVTQSHMPLQWEELMCVQCSVGDSL